MPYARSKGTQLSFFPMKKLLNISSKQKTTYSWLLLVLLNRGQADKWSVPGPKALGPDGSGLGGTSRGGAEVGSGMGMDGSSSCSPRSQKPPNGAWWKSRGSSRVYKAEALLLIRQKSGDAVGFLGNKPPLYKNLTASPPLSVQNDCHVVWSKAGLGEGSKEEGPDGVPPKAGQGPRAITDTDRWCDPDPVGASHLGGGQLTWEVRGHPSWMSWVPRAHSPG